MSDQPGPVWKNPAPDAAAPMAPSGWSGTAVVGARFPEKALLLELKALIESWRSIAQNEHMIDQHYLPTGEALNKAAEQLERLCERYRE